jgi:hypothetical protein
MTGEDRTGSSEFEQRTRAWLVQSAERLPGSVRSRLTRARYAALAAHASPQSSTAVRRWVPAGAVAGVALALFVVLAPHGSGVPARVGTSGPALEDIEMLTDSDALPLSGDQDVDYDFYEWAAGESTSGSASAPIGS